MRPDNNTIYHIYNLFQIKKRIILLFISISLISFKVQSQSLSQYIKTYQNFKKLVYQLYNRNTDSALIISRQAVLYAKATKNDSLIADSYRLLGKSYFYVNQINKAIIFTKIAANISQQIKDTSTLITTYNNIGIIYSTTSHLDSSLYYHKKAFLLARKSKNQAELVECLNNIGSYYLLKDKTQKAKKYYKEAINKALSIHYNEGLSAAYNNMAIISESEGNYQKAIKYLIKASEIFAKEKDSSKMMLAYQNIGVLLNELRMYNKAIEYENKVYNFVHKTNQIDLFLNSISNLSTYYNTQKKYKKSLSILLSNLSTIENSKNNIKKALCYSNIASSYNVLNKPDSAIIFFQRALKLYQTFGMIKEVNEELLKLAICYSKLKDYPKAKKYINQVVTDSSMQTDNTFMKKYYRSYAEVFANLGNKSKAYDYFIKFFQLYDSLNNIKISKQLAELQTKYETAQKEKEIIRQKAEIVKEKAAKKVQEKHIKLLLLILFGSIIFIVFIIISYFQKKKTNRILAEQKRKIEDQNDRLNILLGKITTQRDEIQRVHKEVSQSIDYATKIQKAVLPDFNEISYYVQDFFVSFRPKDRVSGDFYWWTHVNKTTIITVADCTGHGVPGAFMSMLGISLLREIVENGHNINPDSILNQLREEIIKTLKQRGIIGEQKDGMDMALVAIDHKTNTLKFSGANNPIYLITKQILDITNKPKIKLFNYSENNKCYLYELKPDKMPIAIYENMQSFSVCEVTINKGDYLYLFSDGYADQFGGAKGKKFKYKPFKQLLLDNCNLAMNKQKEILEKTFDNWRKGIEQIDDVTVIGIKY